VRGSGLTDFVRVIGYPVRQQMIFKDRAGEPSYLYTALFQQEMFKRGILCYAGLGFSYSHSDAELAYTVRAFGETLAVIARALEADDPRRFLDGRPAEPVFRTLRDQRQTTN
jgi:hypothetical protein